MERLYKKLIIGLGFIFLFVLSGCGSHVIEFNDKSREIEINSIVDYYQFIEEVNNGDIKDVVVDDSQVKLNTLGKYTVTYSLGDKSEDLEIEIVDTIAPKVTLKEKTILYDYDLKADELIDNVTDTTLTTASFKKKYHFNKPGDMEVVVVVEDEGKNKTEATTTVTVLEKDEEKPVINSDEIIIYLDSKVDLKEKIDVSDNQDKNIDLTIDEKELDRSKVGNYTVHVIAIDDSKNQSEKDVNVIVKERVSGNEKVVYLTFDDGPSKYTPEVLKVLDKYNVKATFFVTGINKNYFSYIKTVSDQGHAIGLHTYSHNYSKIYASTDAYFKDLEKIQNLVEEQTGKKSMIIRFPGGSSNTVSKKYSQGIMSELVDMVEEKGYRYFDWNCENGDGYSSMAKSTMIKRATSSNANQIMILMHDANGKKATVETLGKIIKYYQDKGYDFRVIDDSTPDFHQHVNN